jgi:hypothetical protein
VEFSELRHNGVLGSPAGIHCGFIAAVYRAWSGR